jgi:hypothetical protein
MLATRKRSVTSIGVRGVRSADPAAMRTLREPSRARTMTPGAPAATSERASWRSSDARGRAFAGAVNRSPAATATSSSFHIHRL